MINTVKLVKQAAIEAVRAEMPCGVYFATVTHDNPIAVQIHQKLTLTAEFLVFATTSPSVYYVGDKLILLRVQGGQKFVVLSKIR